jgi:hypothetical protein
MLKIQISIPHAVSGGNSGEAYRETITFSFALVTVEYTQTHTHTHIYIYIPSGSLKLLGIS